MIARCRRCRDDERLDVALALAGLAQQVDDGIEVGAQWDLHCDLGSLRPVDDCGVADGIRGQFVVGDHEPGVVVGADEGVREPDLLDDALVAVDDDPVADPQRLREARSGCPATKFDERPLRGEAEDEPEHRPGREHRARDARTCGMTSSPANTATKTIAAMIVRRSTR